MAQKQVKKIVVAGGGTAGWVAAAALAQQLGPLLDITLVESDDIGTVGVGEATIPTVRAFHKLLALDEREFMRATKGTFKLGISFENWARLGDHYFHAFGTLGKSTWMADFHHVWLEAKSKGLKADIGDFCFEHKACRADRFYTSEKSEINYAYHFDAGLYARYLRGYSEQRGVKRIEGKIARVEQNAETGFVEALTLESGARVEGDLFIDCTGFRGLLIEQTLKAGYDDWGKWLPMDSALAVQTPSTEEVLPYTRCIARQAGWQWRIPLQHRVGNGMVFCSEYMPQEEARETLLSNLDAEPLFEPRLIRFRTGRRRKMWDKNVVAMGLSSGFLEPLESTSIHLIMIGVTRLIQLFPFQGCDDALSARYNDQSAVEFERIRDFIILHYKLTERDDTAFWRHCRDMEIPDSLAQRIALFRERAHAFQGPEDLFRVDSWVQVMLGQRLQPEGHHLMGRMMGEDKQVVTALETLSTNIANAVAQLPRHKDFVAQYCPAEPWT